MKSRKINMNKLSGIIFVIMGFQMTFGEDTNYLLALIAMIIGISCFDAD